MEKIGNFNVSYIDTIFGVEGYHDLYNVSTVEMKGKSSILSKRRTQGQQKDLNRIYEFVFIPNSGFLNSNLPLLNNCELKLSFDRVNMEVSMIEGGDVAITQDQTGSPLTIRDCEAITEYITCEELETYFSNIDNGPIPYYYQDCDVTIKTLPKDETNIRLDNIKGGNTPLCVMAGIIPSANLSGGSTISSTEFKCHNVIEFNISLNGNSVNGYPICNKNGSMVFPYYKFMDATSRYMNPDTGEGLKIGQFTYNWVYAHRFEGEASDQGWLGINIKLSEAFDETHSLVIWCVYDCALTIDKFHQVEKLNL